MRIPLFNRLKRQKHKNIALLQDLVVEAVYNIEKNPVLHSDIAIWRCYGGKRFSEDLDFYFVPKKNFKQKLVSEINVFGGKLLKFKVSENNVFSKIGFENSIVSLEISMKNFFFPVVREYEKLDGSFIDVFTLSPEQLFLEKLNAFQNRRLVRDIYDVYHLTSFVSREFPESLKGKIKKIEKPLDEENLKTLVLYGAIPSFNQIKQKLGGLLL